MFHRFSQPLRQVLPVASRIMLLAGLALAGGCSLSGDRCEAACEGRVCGDDGCGGTCGTCVTGATCMRWRASSASPCEPSNGAWSAAG